MATILIAARNLPSGYSQGDPITVMPDNHQWSEAELLPPAQGGMFVRIQLTDVTVEQVRNKIGPLLEPAQEGDIEFGYEEPDRFIKRARRRWSLVLSLIPASVVQQLNQTGKWRGTWTQVRTALRRWRWDRLQDAKVDDGEVTL